MNKSHSPIQAPSGGKTRTTFKSKVVGVIGDILSYIVSPILRKLGYSFEYRIILTDDSWKKKYNL